MTFSTKQILLAGAVSSAMFFAACGGSGSSAPATNSQNSGGSTDTRTAERKLVDTFSDIAKANFEDSVTETKKLQTAVKTFIATPNDANLKAAKDAYIAARKVYSQTEVFRFDEGFVGKVAGENKTGIASVDSWEGQLNAWPLDEALIDYVDLSTYTGGEGYKKADNILNSTSITVGDVTKNVASITPAVLADLNELGGIEANVTSGYHAVEFLLWGQDTNGTAAGAGNRPISDYFTTDAQGKCTSGSTANANHDICKKRGTYLQAAADLLVTDLEGMVTEWSTDTDGNTLRGNLVARASTNAVNQIFYEMGSLALGEIASERMQVALIAGSTEDEHDCFSDTTHNSYAMNAQGIKNIFEGSYGSVSGTGLKQYLIEKGQQASADTLQANFDKVTTDFNAIVDSAENKNVKVDQLIATVAQAAKSGVSEADQTARRKLISDAVSDLQIVADSLSKAAATVGITDLSPDGGSQFSQSGNKPS